MGYLLDNILKQREELRRVGKTPIKLRCDLDSLDALIDEVAPFMSTTYQSFSEPIRVYGLAIEISDSPDFDVIAATQT